MKSKPVLLLTRLSGAVALCLSLAGCPSSSNPTQPQTPSIPGATPPSSSSSSSPGSSSSGSSSPGAAAPGGERAPRASAPDSDGSQSQSGSPSTVGTTPAEAGRDNRAGDTGDFPGGEFPGTGSDRTAGGEGTGDTSGNSGAADAGEPGFDTGGAGGDMLPDMRDEPTFDEVLSSTQAAMGGGSEASQRGEQAGTAAGGPPGGVGDGSAALPGSEAGAEGSGSNGPLTPAERVVVLDDELQKGTGEFDDMILEEQAGQRRAARERSTTATSDSAEAGSGRGAGYDPDNPPEGGSADAGGYSTGGGMGGASSTGSSLPKNTARYPPPPDIPDGDDDDVVARQLREAAMREPDPAVREKLWDEYRKYKGIDQ